jgi:tetratricopeptide (TPR) repeat protein
VAASKNDGNETYNIQIKAIGVNPNYAYYREIYSQTNLALAQNILSVEEVSDTDKEKASTLVQQAVREAKSAVSLEENNSIYWSNLASIYRSLVGVVDGAADWSLQAYQQTIVLNPVDPITNLNMGGLYYAAEQYDSAERSFEESVKVKQDYANAWYNWAYAAKKLNKLDIAVSRLQQALTLVAADSSDYEAAAKELETWKQEQTEANAKKAETQQTQQTSQQTTQQTTEQTKQVVETPMETVAPTAAVTPVMEVEPSPIVQQ